MFEAMCMMCNGASLDEVRFYIHGIIERVGWAVVPVEGRRPSNCWAYTIGLSRLGHSELVTVGRAPEAAGRLLNALAKRIARGESFEPAGPIVEVGGRRYGFSPIHPTHWEKGTFAVWVDYYGALGPPRPEPRAIEVVPQEHEPALGTSNPRLPIP